MDYKVNVENPDRAKARPFNNRLNPFASGTDIGRLRMAFRYSKLGIKKMKDFELLFGNTENLCASKRNKILVTRQANILRPRSQN